jgi:3-dehydroquinate synthase
MKTIHVSLGERSYPIQIASGLIGNVGPLMRENASTKDVFIVTDQNVEPLYGQKVFRSLASSGFRVECHVVPAGEESKSIETASVLYTHLLRFQLKRDGWIVALGGGVVGDLAGFAAATYLRGVPFVQIPTTLLSQVDSSVGGKVGINHPMGKNVIGCFYQPQFVIIDPDALNTLDRRERWSGLAEVVKYGLIADEALFNLLETNISDMANPIATKSLEDVLFRCCQIKADVVQKDETENGLRRILNFGHTLGHAVEVLGDFHLFRHGEAVVAGMLWASWLSRQKGYLSEDKCSRIRSLLKLFPAPSRLVLIQASRLEEKVRLDKKQSADGIHLVLLKDIGQTIVEKTVLESWMIEQGWHYAIS